MKLKEILKSELDASVNFIFDNMMEARLVNRGKGYLSIYVSSHTGCNKACRFCHLTQTKQTEFIHTTVEEYAIQVKTVFDYYLDNLKPYEPLVDSVYINFMARGEVFANKYILEQGNNVFSAITSILDNFGFNIKFQISTIMPTEVEDLDLSTLFDYSKYTVDIHYSLYSFDEVFRKKWIPKAITPIKAFTLLSDLKKKSIVDVTLHWAYINNANDSVDNLNDLISITKQFNLDYKVNIVRYNPYSENQGTESPEHRIELRAQQMRDLIGIPVKIIPRVGLDVKASCGTFVS